MPTANFLFFNSTPYTYDGNYLYISHGICSLPTLGDDGEFDSRGKATTPADITFPEFSAEGLTDLTGAQIRGTIPDGSDIGFRVSLDGVTWYWFDGVAWNAVAIPNDWTDWRDFDAGVAQLFTALPSKQYTFKMLLTPNSDGEPPEIEGVFIHHELFYHFHEDVKRTIKHFFDNDIIIRGTTATKVGAAPVVQIPFDTDFQTVHGIIAVYDITNDPHRLVNLYASMASPTVINLTSPVSNADIEIQFNASTESFIAVDPEFNDSVLPSIVLQFPDSVVDYDEGTTYIYEKLESKGVFRRRFEPMRERISFRVSCLSTRETTALAINDAVNRKFQAKELLIKSIASWKDISILTFTPLEDNDIIKRGLHVKVSVMEIEAVRDFFEYTDSPILEQIRLSTAPGVTGKVERQLVEE